MVTLSLTAEQIDQLRNIAAVGGKWLMAAFTALGGLAGIAKIITTFVARKKPVKLSNADHQAIANAIVEKTNGSIEIDMSSEIEKATRNRLQAVEKINAEIVKTCKQLVKSQKAIANAVSDFKTISTSARDELKESMKDLADGENGLVAVEKPVVDKPIVKIEKVAENENTPLY